MARKAQAKDLPTAVNEVCLWLPGSEMRPAHGSPDYKVAGRSFATFVINHHGDGRVALWLAAAQGAQHRFVRDEPEHYFVPPYVGPRGWLGVHLNTGLPWAHVARRVREAYEQVAPRKLIAELGPTPALSPPTVDIDPEVFDPLSAPRPRKIVGQLRALCLALPETGEGLQFGQPCWRAGRKTFCSVHRYQRRLTLSVWVGVEQQVNLTFAPRYRIPAYSGGNGWIELDMEDELNWPEVEALLDISYRHFALQRMLNALAGGQAPGLQASAGAAARRLAKGRAIARANPRPTTKVPAKTAAGVTAKVGKTGAGRTNVVPRPKSGVRTRQRSDR